MKKNQEEKKNQEKKKQEEKKQEEKYTPDDYESLIRILTYDIPGNKRVIVGLTRVKGISWNIANAVCKKLNISPDKKISELSKEEIKKIEEYITNPVLPEFLMNRRKDLETGENLHLHGTDLDLKKEFDIKRLRKMKSLKGIRHAAGLPVRGQRTRSNFRTHGRKAVGVRRKAK